MAFKFTFQTDQELLCKEVEGYDDTFDIMRVKVMQTNNSTFDFPIKTKESFNQFFLDLETSENKLIEMYPAKHGFERLFEMD